MNFANANKNSIKKTQPKKKNSVRKIILKKMRLRLQKKSDGALRVLKNACLPTVSDLR